MSCRIAAYTKFNDRIKPEICKYCEFMRFASSVAGSVITTLIKTCNYNNRKQWRVHDLCKDASMIYNFTCQIIEKYKKMHKITELNDLEKCIFRLDKLDIIDFIILLRYLEFLLNEITKIDSFIERLTKKYPAEMEMLLEKLKELDEKK